MKKIEQLRQILVGEIRKLISDRTYYADYLRQLPLFMNSEAFNLMLIHAQNPKATILQTADKWNDLNRWILPSSIATKNISIHYNNRIVDMYDVADTGLSISKPSTQNLSHWTINIAEAKYLCQAIKNVYGIDDSANMYQTFKNLIRKEYATLTDESVNAISYAVCSRLVYNTHLKFACDDDIYLPQCESVKQALCISDSIISATKGTLKIAAEYIKMCRADKPLPERRQTEAETENEEEIAEIEQPIIEAAVLPEPENIDNEIVEDSISESALNNIALVIKDDTITKITLDELDNKESKKLLGGKCKLVSVVNGIEFYNGPIKKNTPTVISELSNGVRLTGHTICFKQGGLTDEDIEFIHSIADNREVTYTSPAQQSSLFDSDENESSITEATAIVDNVASPDFKALNTAFSDFLLIGSDLKNSKLAICTYYMYENDIDKRAAFVKNMYLNNTWSGYRGYILDSIQYTFHVDEDGLGVCKGKSFNEDNAVHISWSAVAEHIDSMLSDGRYLSQPEIEESESITVYRIAELLSFVDRELDSESRIVPDVDRYTYPKCTYTITATFSDKDRLSQHIAKLDKLADSNDVRLYVKNHSRNISIFLKALQNGVSNSYTADSALIKPQGKFCISENEKEYAALTNSVYANGEYDVYKFFCEHEDKKECSDFIKGYYGWGGRSCDGYSTEHSSKGLKLTRESYGSEFVGSEDRVYDSIQLSCADVASIIRKAIDNNIYFTDEKSKNKAIAYYRDKYIKEYVKNEVSDEVYSLQKIIENLGGVVPAVDNILDSTDNNQTEVIDDVIDNKENEIVSESIAFGGAEPTVYFEWSEDRYIPDEIELPFSRANALITYLDKKQNYERDLPDAVNLGYNKTKFRITSADGEYTYSGRYDIGDGEGGFIPHIKSSCEWVLSDKSMTYDEETLEDTKFCLSSFIPYLEQYVEEMSNDDVISLINSISDNKIEIEEEHTEVVITDETESTTTSPNIKIGDVIRFENGRYQVETINSICGTTRYSMLDLTLAYPISRIVYLNELVEGGYSIENEEEVSIEEVSTDETINDTADYQSENTRVVNGAKSQYANNVDAIRLLKQLEAEGRMANPNEQKILAGYCGWGGCANAFDANREEWKKEYEELKELLTPAEYAAAQQSSLTAFYTPHYITSAITDKLVEMGARGGRILEPALGTGAFFAAMPQTMKSRSDLFGVELDEVSGRIARQLQQRANIQIAGFEHANFLPNTFDIIISNVPFGDVGVADSKYNKYSFKIHDYFFAKSADLLRPNGVMAMITSAGTLDKQTDTLRNYLAQRCDFIGAVRLPNNTFGGTKAVSDIIFLQKREIPLENVDTNESWHRTGLTDEGYELNQYFIDNPHLILGELKPDTRYGDSRDYTVAPKPGVDMDQAVKEALSSFILERDFAYNPAQAEMESDNKLPAPPDARNYTYYIKDDKIYYCENDVLTLQEEFKNGGTKYNRLVALDKVRHAYRELIQGQASACSDERLNELQNELNTAYDTFVDKYGYISDKIIEQSFQKDDDYNLLLSLEIKNEETKEVKKAEIFTKRVIRPQTEITEVYTATEALNVSLDRKGRIDIPYMLSIYPNHTKNDLLNELGSLVYRNPLMAKVDDEYSGYETAFDYLCGDVRQKLHIAKGAATENPDYQRNVEALTAVIPEPLEAHEISVKLGASWIDIEDYSQFMVDTFKTPRYLYSSMWGRHISITRVDYTGEWKISSPRLDTSFNATQVYGTSRLSAYEILERLLNQRQIVVKDRVEDGDKVKYVFNAKETAKAQECARKIKEAWADWIFATPERREKYVERYNETFNGIRPRDYSDVRLSYPGMSPSIELKEHQHTAVARCVFNGNTLLAHCVGAGKTFEMCAATMEKIRLGLIHKACVVVPKHLLYQTASEWQRLYPQAHILVATEKDFAKANRQRFVARCATGSYDCVMMSYQQFEAIKMSKDYQTSFISAEILSLNEAINELDSEEDKITVKQLERAKKSLEVKLEKIITRKEDILSFEQMGIDSLVVDEAHAYKNCLIPTKISNVSGVSNAHSERSEDMLMKCRWLNEQYGYRNIIFATGTPVSNSMVELYTMQRYLRPDALQKVRCMHFDDWAANFGEVVTQLEMKPAGDGFQMKSRFAKFVNLPELMALYKEFADVITADMIDLDVPEIKGEQAQIIVAPVSEFQTLVMKELSARTERIHNGGVDSRIDNMLKITHEARLLGLDGRAIEPTSDNYSFSKVNRCIDEVIRIYNDTSDNKGVQIIWSDIAVNDSNGFSVYDYLTDELAARGIPENEIAKIGDAKTDAKRAELFAQLRSGAKRIVIASTSKLGTGANIQTRLAACHHLDIPWRPADLEQRNGRIVRQGNGYDEVEIIHYTTAKTFDAYMLNIITTKQKFISQIMTSQSPVRVCEDVDELVLTYSEFQAVTTGNQLIKEKYELEMAVSQLTEVEAEWKKSRYKMQDDIYKVLPNKIEQCKAALDKVQADVDEHKSYETDNFKITLAGKEYNERAKAADVLSAYIGKCNVTGEKINVGEFMGYKLTLQKVVPALNVESYVEIVLSNHSRYHVDLNGSTGIGSITRLENAYKKAPFEKHKKIEQELAKNEADLETAKAEYEKPFGRADELQEKRQRLIEVNNELSQKQDEVIDDTIEKSDTPAVIDVEEYEAVE